MVVKFADAKKRDSGVGLPRNPLDMWQPGLRRPGPDLAELAGVASPCLSASCQVHLHKVCQELIFETCDSGLRLPRNPLDMWQPGLRRPGPGLTELAGVASPCLSASCQLHLHKVCQELIFETCDSGLGLPRNPLDMWQPGLRRPGPDRAELAGVVNSAVSALTDVLPGYQ